MSETLAHNVEEKPRTNDIVIQENFTFDSLILSPPILQGLKDAGFYKPSPIQLKAVPLGKCGLDLIVQAKSGTGKTVVFTLIALEMVNTNKNVLQCLIFAPTREIAVQIEDVIRTIGKHKQSLKIGSFIGGLPLENDIEKVKGCHIAVGAPGRLKHLVEKGYLKICNICLFILDEADKLMEQAFQNDINYVYSKLPKRKQVLTLSATYSEELRRFLENYMQSPTYVTPEVESPLLLGIKQFVTIVKEYINVNRQITTKTEELIRLLKKIKYTQCLIFFNSQSRTEGISNTLNRDGWNTLYISAGQTQSERLKVVKKLKDFECRILLSTDLTARGIDAANVDLIINYDVPYETAIYLHRMGRAGRYGSRGVCITIAGHNTEIQKLQGILGEIGGTELSIAKLPDDIEATVKLWECDYNSFEKVHGIINDVNVKSNSSQNLKNSVLHMKAKQKESVDTEIVSSNLQKLTVTENLNQDCCETSEGSDNILTDKCQNYSECLKVENSNHFSNMQETTNVADEDAETLFKRLAAGEEISLVIDEKLDKHSEEVNDKFGDVDTETVIKSLAAGEDISVVISEKSQKPSPESELVQEESVKENNSSVNDEEKIEGMNDWHPWVPVEGYSVFKTNKNQVNLLEDFLKESTKTKRTKRKISQKSPITEAKKYQKATDDEINSEVPLRNVALLSVCKLSEEDTSEQDLKKHVNSITNYLNYMKDKRNTEMGTISQQFENVDCDDLLKNVNQYSQQCKVASEIIDPIEDIFRLGYNDIVKNGVSWIDALGDKYDLEEESSESVIEEDMEYDLEEEYEEEYEDEDEYQNEEEIDTQAQANQNASSNQNFYPMDLAHRHSGYFDDISGDIYDWHFDYHGQNFLEKANRFEDVASCNRYLDDWQWQILQCRDFVRQHIYLQEMNHYLMHKGNAFYNNDPNGASTSMQQNNAHDPRHYSHNSYKSYYDDSSNNFCNRPYHKE